MATDSPVPQPGARPVTPALMHRSAPASSDQLRRHLRSRLERHVRTEAFRPALTIVGVRGDVVDVLRHGTGRPEEAVTRAGTTFGIFRRWGAGILGRLDPTWQIP